MFDITSSKLLILAVVALIVVGPKDLPILLRTLGKYLGVIRRHAAEFRGQFDEAMREAELDGLKKEFEAVSREVRSTIDIGSRAIDTQIEASRVDVETPKVGLSAAPAAEPVLPEAPETALPAPSEPANEPAKEPDRGAA
ncbi:MAG: Sec-independent protein translocase protein TatB [Hyphomicrobium sp.]|nr:Sec-independent protein translocase protein TatB [Hyphomicrobium sp.]